MGKNFPHAFDDDFIIVLYLKCNIFDLSTRRTRVGANQPGHWFLGGKGLGIPKGTSVWVGLPKSITRDHTYPNIENNSPMNLFILIYIHY
jgi:hypothetical protein